MQLPLLFGWRLSAVLNKYPYGTCLNPHIGVYRPQRGGLFIRFPAHWPVWNWNVHPRDRRHANALRAEPRKFSSLGVRKVVGIGSLFSVFQYATGVINIYVKIPFSKTFKWSFKGKPTHG